MVERFGLALALCLAPACKGGDAEADSASQAATPAAAPVDVGAAFEVHDASGVWAAAEPYEGGFRLKSASGEKKGKIRVQADRVKVKGLDDATIAKVKTKDYGFKIYEGDEADVARAKRKGAGYKLSTKDGKPIGELNVNGPGGELAGGKVTVETKDGKVIVSRDGAPVGSVSTAIKPAAAAFLGVTELGWEQRVAAMVFVQQKGG